MSGRTAIIGDIHGMLPEFRSLMERLGLDNGDRLVLVGDLVDKGPDSVGVVKYARSLRDSGLNVVLVQGNHEEKHARYRLAYSKAGEKGVRKFKGREEIGAITAGLSPEDVAFLDSAVPFHEIPEHGAVVVHGGILPVWESLDASDKGVVSRMLRVRHVTGKTVVKYTVEFTYEGEDFGSLNIPELVKRAKESLPIREQRRPRGSFISLGQEGPDDPFWADVYDGRFGHVYFGHSPYPEAEEPVRFDHATALDLGAVFGGRLAAAVLEVGQEPRFVTVHASGKYAASFWEGEDE